MDPAALKLRDATFESTQSSGIQMIKTSTHSRRQLRSTAAILLGTFAVVVLSIGTDRLLQALKVYPPSEEPMYDTSLNMLALAYRCVYAVVGSLIAARLAPHAPMGHALALGIIGFVASTVGAIHMIGRDLGPAWYAIALVVSALPCAWLGGLLYRCSMHTQRP